MIDHAIAHHSEAVTDARRQSARGGRAVLVEQGLGAVNDYHHGRWQVCERDLMDLGRSS